MAKTKYRPDFPKRAEEYAKEGMIDIEIAMKLGISKDTFYKYILRYPDFADALKRGKAPVDQEVEMALLKRAMGFEYEETTVEYKPVVVLDGQPAPKATVRSLKKVKKIVIPDVTADIFWLKNRMPKRWKDKQDVNLNVKGSLSIPEMKKNLKEAKENGSE